MCCFSLPAQNASGTGGISGIVTDASGAVVPGARVSVDNAAKGIHRELSTTDAGIFAAPSLVPASGYSAKVTRDGFSAYEATNITVQVGETVSLTPRLQISSSTTKVEVTAAAPVINTTQTDVSQVVSSRQLMDLPINGRRVDSFVLLTPGVTSDQAFGLLTFRGNPGGNSFLTDGIDTTNQFYDENAGRTRTYNISQDAVQEFQVIASNFLAEYGNASGGVVNTITRSGSNDLHGTAYWFFRNRTLNATDPEAQGINPQDWRHQAGVSVGGPIKKEKLFYFFNGEVQRRDFPIVSTNTGNLTLFNAQGQYLPTSPQGKPNCGAPATAAQCAAAIAYIESRVAPQLVPRTSDVNLLFGKIDYQINDNNRWTTEMSYLDFDSPNGIQTQAALSNGAGIGNNADTTVFDRTVKSNLTSVLSPNAVNELRFGMFKDRQYDPASASLLPSVGPIALSVGTPAISNLGYATSYPRLLPSELHFQGSDTFSYTAGKHSLKFGYDYEHVEDYVYSIPNVDGTYSYNSLTAFAEDFSGNSGAKNWSRFSQTFGNPNIDLNFNEFGLFAQDEWHITPKLTISPGLRYEKTFLPEPTETNAAWPLTGHIPQTDLNLAPRLGLAYQIDSKTVFRTGYGIFYNRYVSAGIESLFLNNGLNQMSYTLQNTVAAQVQAGPVFPNPLAAPPNVKNLQGAATVDFADPSWRNAYSEQATAAIQREIAPGTSLTVSGIWSRSLHITSASDANAAAPTSNYTYYILNSAGQQVGTYTTPIYTKRINPAYGSIIEMQSNANSYYNALVVQLQKRYTNWFQADAAYTWSHAIDDNIGGAAGGPGGSSGILYAPYYPTSVFNGNEQFEKGSSSNDQRHRLVLNGVFNPTFTHGNGWSDRYLINGWQLSVISTFGSSFALPTTVSVNSSVLPKGLGLLQTGTLDGLGGSTRVPFESISVLNIAPIFRTDARLSKIFPIGERLRLQLMFEATNLFNHFILEGSAPRIAQQYTTVAYNGGVGLMPYQYYGAATQTQAPPDGTTARRAQAALRITW
ncbi:MAG: TonB-dependent receptor [Acidobacteriaceae bacterium]|nr:TonB-dependent receptor [Acidobacteriaceae bacterium]